MSKHLTDDYESTAKQWEQLANAIRAVREFNGRVIGEAFDRTELHGKIDQHPL